MSTLRHHFHRNLPVWVTGGILLGLYVAAGLLYDGFFGGRVAASLFSDNAFLGIAALGMTLVIFSGGIDLSVGAVLGFATILCATLIGDHGWPPALAWAAALAAGTGFGFVMGWLIEGFRLPPFLVTLAGMFFARGVAFWINTESVAITHPWYETLGDAHLPIAGVRLPLPGILLLAVGGIIYTIGHHTRFGRNLLAIGGNEQSALLMGLPVARTRIGVYALNSACAALAGIVATFYTGSGNSSMGTGLELDAIAVVVIGGTLLTGGRGHVAGTLLGVLIFGVIQSAILFDGRLSSWWMRIVVGVLLLAFIVLQRFLITRKAAR